MKALAVLLFPLLPTMGVPNSLPPENPIMVRAKEAYGDVQWVFAQESIKSRIDAKDIERWEDMTFVMHGKEASFFTNPRGSNDNGKACGAIQAHGDYLPTGITCKAARESRRIGLLAGVTIALDWRDRCETGFAGAWSAYATGKCPPKRFALQLILERCKIAGVTCS